MSAEGLKHPRCLEYPVARDKMASSRANTTRIAMRDDPLCINKSHVMRGPTRYESVSNPKIDRYMQ